jgi:hypothetical protein
MSSVVIPQWPALGAEERPWVPGIPADAVPRAVRARHVGPYRAAVVPAIADVRVGLPSDVAALEAEATAEIARFDAEVGAELAPFAVVLLRSESASSSMIENVTSGARAIVLAEMGSTEKRNAQQIVGNVAAMRAALDLADDVDEQAVLAMHDALLRTVDPGIAGRWRAEQVWIGGDSYGPHGAEYECGRDDRPVEGPERDALPAQAGGRPPGHAVEVGRDLAARGSRQPADRYGEGLDSRAAHPDHGIVRHCRGRVVQVRTEARETLDAALARGERHVGVPSPSGRRSADRRVPVRHARPRWCDKEVAPQTQHEQSCTGVYGHAS